MLSAKVVNKGLTGSFSLSAAVYALYLYFALVYLFIKNPTACSREKIKYYKKNKYILTLNLFSNRQNLSKTFMNKYGHKLKNC